MRVQAVGRDAVTPDNHSGFWHQRYTLRGAASASGGKQSGLPAAEPGVKYHPVFLENLKDTILTTGVPVFLATSCVCLLSAEDSYEDGLVVCRSWCNSIASPL